PSPFWTGGSDERPSGDVDDVVEQRCASPVARTADTLAGPMISEARGRVADRANRPAGCRAGDEKTNAILFLGPLLRVEPAAQAVGQHVEAEDRGDDGEAGKDHDPWGLEHEAAAVREHES